MAMAVDEAEFEGWVEAVIEEAGEVLLVNAEVELEDDELEDKEVVALVEAEDMATILKLLLEIAAVVLPGSNIAK